MKKYLHFLFPCLPTAIFILLGITFTFFYWKTDISDFLLDHAYFQSFAFLYGLPNPKTDLILPYYNPVKDIFSWFVAALANGNMTVLRLIWGIWAGLGLGLFFATIRRLFIKDKNFYAFVSLLFLTGLTLWKAQLGAYVNLWLPMLCALGALFILLGEKENAFKTACAGLLTGMSVGFSTPWLYWLGTLTLFLALKTSKKVRYTTLFLLTASIAAAVLLAPWIYKLISAGFVWSFKDWFTEGLQIQSIAPVFIESWIQYLCILAPWIAIGFRRYIHSPKSTAPTLFDYYCIAVGIVWLGAVVVNINRNMSFLCKGDNGFVLCLLALPTLVGGIGFLKKQIQQFILGFLCMAFWLYTNPGIIGKPLHTDKFLSAVFPYSIKPGDIIVLKGKNTAWLGTFFPQRVQLTNTLPISVHDGQQVYMIFNNRYTWKSVPKTASKLDSIPQYVDIRENISPWKQIEPCQPIITNYTALKKYLPVMCKMYNPSDS